jgi:hypothetical protein
MGKSRGWTTSDPGPPVWRDEEHLLIAGRKWSTTQSAPSDAFGRLVTQEAARALLVEADVHVAATTEAGDTGRGLSFTSTLSPRFSGRSSSAALVGPCLAGPSCCGHCSSWWW